jgi:DMSO/TMAO reductase YedYZ molybdopterin-dependent catalytic subunit
MAKNQDVPSPDSDADRQIRRMTRRSLVVGGVAAGAGLLSWLGVRSASLEDGISWPLRRVLEFNEKLAGAAFRDSRLAPEFSPARATEPRVNGWIGLDEDLDPAKWRLQVFSRGGAPKRFTLDDIKALPAVSMTTELKCIEGWSNIVHWTGARLVDLAARYGLGSRNGQPFDADKKPADLFRYVRLETPTGEYYVGLDTASALHPQTLLCYAMNGEPLTPGHGAPLRLVIPVKYGIKNIKRIGTIRFTDERPGDYWAERGYDWYAGH